MNPSANERQALALIQELTERLQTIAIAQNYLIGKPERPAVPTISDYVWVLGDVKNIAEKAIAGKRPEEPGSLRILRNWPREAERK